MEAWARCSIWLRQVLVLVECMLSVVKAHKKCRKALKTEAAEKAKNLADTKES